MRHVILGAGGVGGLVGGSLAAAGEQVDVIIREGTDHPAQIKIDSKVFGPRSGAVSVSNALSHDADILWVTTKSHQLENALRAVPQRKDAFGLVISLLNGIDHVGVLSEIYGSRVVPGVIQVHAERTAPGRISHYRWHVPAPPDGQPWSADQVHPLELAPGDETLDLSKSLAAKLSSLNIPTRIRRDAATMLWNKLTIIAVGAVGFTAAGSAGELRSDPHLMTLIRRAIDECVAVAASEGGVVDTVRALQTINGFPPESTSSLQRDVDAGRETEIDFLSGSVIRRGEARGIDVSAIRTLDGLVRKRLLSSPRR